ncbi:MAG: hypothetical protein CSA42_06300 [Gammaproteobacteria bacterium]|nr:MAG: hypothetical protein CSA42_06300 [Gammaproteobacteria bacterium]
MLASIFSNLSGLSVLGYGLLVAGIIATVFSKQRYLLLYTLAGMGYWLSIEMLQSAIIRILPLSEWNGYVAAMLVSWFVFILWLGYRHIYITPRKQQAQASAEAKYVEHTPVYKNYHPKFQ